MTATNKTVFLLIRETADGEETAGVFSTMKRAQLAAEDDCQEGLEDDGYPLRWSKDGLGGFEALCEALEVSWTIKPVLMDSRF